MKIHNSKTGWLLVLPVVLLVAFSAIIPLITVVNYSLQDIFDVNNRLFVGFDWYREVLNDERLIDAFGRQLGFSSLILAIEIPLGLLLALNLPRQGRLSTLSLIILALPLLIPFNVIGTIWQIFSRADIGLLGHTINTLGIDYNYATQPIDAWLTLLVMDIWHWTPLVTLLCFAGLQSIPNAYYQAASIDGASRFQVFRYIELPKLKGVLTIAVLLRFMDSFMIYTEPFVLTGGGPGNTTTFLSQYLANIALGQFDLGKAAAFSIIYFLIILLFSFVFYKAMTQNNETN